jgi:hypothetical protein
MVQSFGEVLSVCGLGGWAGEVLPVDVVDLVWEACGSLCGWVVSVGALVCWLVDIAVPCECVLGGRLGISVASRVDSEYTKLCIVT